MINKEVVVRFFTRLEKAKNDKEKQEVVKQAGIYNFLFTSMDDFSESDAKRIRIKWLLSYLEDAVDYGYIQGYNEAQREETER